jgi:hypothetical protein
MSKLHSKTKGDKTPQFEKRKTQRNEQKTKERTQTETAKNKFNETDVQADMIDKVLGVVCNKAPVASICFTFAGQNTSLNRCSKGVKSANNEFKEREASQRQMVRKSHSVGWAVTTTAHKEKI